MKFFFCFILCFKSFIERFYHMITNIIMKRTINMMFWFRIDNHKRHMISIKVNTSSVTATTKGSALPMTNLPLWQKGNNIMRLRNWQHSTWYLWEKCVNWYWQYQSVTMVRGCAFVTLRDFLKRVRAVLLSFTLDKQKAIKTLILEYSNVQR